MLPARGSGFKSQCHQRNPCKKTVGDWGRWTPDMASAGQPGAVPGTGTLSRSSPVTGLSPDQWWHVRPVAAGPVWSCVILGRLLDLSVFWFRCWRVSVAPSPSPPMMVSITGESCRGCREMHGVFSQGNSQKPHGPAAIGQCPGTVAPALPHLAIPVPAMCDPKGTCHSLPHPAP